MIAETISGSIADFVDLMNRTAEAYGCTNTHFANPNGLHDPNHYTTARDMAIIAREAMKNETFRELRQRCPIPCRRPISSAPEPLRCGTTPL